MEADLEIDEISDRVGRRLLVVDDLVDAAEGLAAILRLSGHDVRVAHSGADAVRVAGTFEPEITILDVALPDMDGYELARCLRRAAGSPIVVVALTGYAPDTVARPEEFDYYLVKPADLGELRSIVDRPL